MRLRLSAAACPVGFGFGSEEGASIALPAGFDEAALVFYPRVRATTGGTDSSAVSLAIIRDNDKALLAQSTLDSDSRPRVRG